MSKTGSTTYKLLAVGRAGRGKRGRSGGKKRPADILIFSWLDGHPLALDATVTQPLAPGLGLDAAAAKKTSLKPWSARKISRTGVVRHCQLGV